MKPIIIFILIILPFIILAEDHNAKFIGKWEYRQRAGDSYDQEGEILTFILVKDRVEGEYFGLERGGEDGLFYTAVKIKDLTISNDGKISFIVPGRTMFTKRPKSIQAALHSKVSSGFTNEELNFSGSILDNKLKLICTSDIDNYFCPETEMVFQKSE